jgi:hypothetical protein
VTGYIGSNPRGGGLCTSLTGVGRTGNVRIHDTEAAEENGRGDRYEARVGNPEELKSAAGTESVHANGNGATEL